MDDEKLAGVVVFCRVDLSLSLFSKSRAASGRKRGEEEEVEEEGSTVLTAYEMIAKSMNDLSLGGLGAWAWRHSVMSPMS